MTALPYWPRRLNATWAAAYCGLSVGMFQRRVVAGDYPQGARDGNRKLWYREDLDMSLDLLKGGLDYTGDLMLRALEENGVK